MLRCHSYVMCLELFPKFCSGLFTSFSKSSFFVRFYIFVFLPHVPPEMTKKCMFSRISADYHEKIPEAVDVCRDLISSYSKHINDMLKIQRAPRERVLNLELLTGRYSYGLSCPEGSS